MTTALAILGYVILAAAGAALAAIIVALPFAVLASMKAIQHDDAVADAASGMDEFSAPEGGQRR